VILTTDRLVLRPQEAADAAALFTILGDPAAMRYWGRPAITRLKVVEELMSGQQAAMAEGSCQYWTITEGGAVIGSLDISLIRDGSAELGFLLRRDRWGQGLATEAARAVSNYGLGAMGLERLAAAILAANVAASRVLEKIGFQEVDRREAVLPSGEQRACAFYLRKRA
jgi:ribosomal-protein-alanine N-acetyltransferase